MTVSASWPGGIASACGLSRETATISATDFPLLLWRSGICPARSCVIDGEAIVTDDKGLANFDLMRSRRIHATAILCAFDLLELDGDDLRGFPIERK